MDIRLVDSELNVMEVLWREGELPAKEISVILNKEIGWNKNTTYTIIKRCIDKEAILRVEPNFVCRPLINKEQVQAYEVESLINKMFSGSAELLFASLVGQKKLSNVSVDKLRSIIDEAEVEE